MGAEGLPPLPGAGEPGGIAAYHAEGRKRRTRRTVIACVAAVIMLAGIAIFVTRHQGGTAAQSPGSARGGAKAGASASGASSAPASPGPISLQQVSPDTRLVADGMSFHRVASQVDAKCSLAAHGTFAAALVSAGCEQVIRATYVSSTLRYAVTEGVAVLPTLAAARQADDSKKFGPDIWFTGLNGPAGSSGALITKSGGYGYDVLDGRYILFAFTTYSDGRSPTSRDADLPLLTSLSSSFTQLEQQSITAHVKP